MRVLMVCLGNICRSPLAEGILAHKAAQKGLDWQVDSAGTGSWHIGNPPDARSVRTAKKYSVDISKQRARQFQSADFQDFDLIFAMDAQNQRDILRLAKSEAERQKVRLILDLTYPGQNKGVPDPYYGEEAHFEEVFHLLDTACEAVCNEMDTPEH